jgi:hypothetical protein
MKAVTDHRTDPGRSRRHGPEEPVPGPAWRRVAVVVVLIALGVLLVQDIGDLTQSRADHVEPGSRSEIVLAVDTRGYQQPDEDAARNLWAACAGTMTHRLVADSAFVPVGSGEVRFSVEPGLGPNARRKLVGCLEDTTLDRVKGNVQSVELINP